MRYFIKINNDWSEVPSKGNLMIGQPAKIEDDNGGAISTTNYQLQAESKIVKWATFESLLDDSVINELNAIRDRVTPTNKNTRLAVIELINDMNSDNNFDAFGSEISSLLSKMVATNLITLDQVTADDILTELKS